MTELTPGRVIWADLGQTVGREQRGRRPAVVVSTRDHLTGADTLVTVVPCTRRQHHWVNHVELVGPTQLSVVSFAMTEQIRTLSRQRIHRIAGYVSIDCLHAISRWLTTWHVPGTITA